jgi:hypothetical protein
MDLKPKAENIDTRRKSRQSVFADECNPEMQKVELAGVITD